MAVGVKKFPEDSLESKVYAIVEKYSNYLPVANDRNRFAYSLIKYVQGEGDAPAVLVKTAKLTINNISAEELGSKINSEIEPLKKIS